jgi:hypothetical protein
MLSGFATTDPRFADSDRQIWKLVRSHETHFGWSVGEPSKRRIARCTAANTRCRADGHSSTRCSTPTNSVFACPDERTVGTDSRSAIMASMMLVYWKAQPSGVRRISEPDRLPGEYSSPCVSTTIGKEVGKCLANSRCKANTYGRAHKWQIPSFSTLFRSG